MWHWYSADMEVPLSCASGWWWLQRVRSCIASDPSANILMLRLQFLPCALSFCFPGLVSRPTGGGFQLLLLSLGQLREWLSISWWLDVMMSPLHLPLSRKQSSWLTWSTRRESEKAATQIWQVFITQDCSWQKEVKKSFKNNRKNCYLSWDIVVIFFSFLYIPDTFAFDISLWTFLQMQYHVIFS